MNVLLHDTDRSKPVGWSRMARNLASCAILLHLIAIVAAPAAGPGPASYLAVSIRGFFRPYLQATYMNHGYRFFAPNPGPSHLVRYEIDMADGSKKEGRFPDTEEHWPRLLYHRYLMMSENAFELYAPVAEPPPNDIPADILSIYETEKDKADLFMEAISKNLLAEHGGDRVRLYLIQHDIPFPDAVRQGQKLDDESLYRELFQLGEFSKQQFAEDAS